MTPPTETPASGSARSAVPFEAGSAPVAAPLAAFRDWIETRALPFQAQAVRDPAGGFHERIAPDGHPVAMPRRARVAARQLYAFSRLAGLGLGDTVGPGLAGHARDMLLGAHIRPDGRIVPLAGGPEGYDLYDIAFCLFALAAAPEVVLPRAGACALAAQILTRLEAGWRHPEMGFEEAMPRRLPLRSNPHMHLFEASLEWLATGPCDPRFEALADEIAGLCLARFLDPATGALRELFDGDWQVAPGAENAVEPGHQYEWGWLLLRWGALRDRAEARRAGLGLIDLAETRGLNADGLAASLLDPALAMADPTARLWPQTERIKAWALRARLATRRAEAALTEAKAVEACQGLMRFLQHPLRGSWWENLAEGGAPRREPARTSSLYHIVGAYHELAALEARRSLPVAKEETRASSTA
ncbi:AGE family epimerase/isomerase [Rhodovulum sulfidophilum]|uniref:AGE family epimerase/isomerase n=2 Tax=Rhodovulum sulfidophilum TaxID=35806 RepID=A0ABS1RQH5_RHOSU|nr:AGE family epimerase/isomerase [Rhodovulum sulfidophilum]MBL3608316.1 AGE family epimerase/isomerase [Rhodovulum sulfidophilum]